MTIDATGKQGAVQGQGTGNGGGGHGIRHPQLMKGVSISGETVVFVGYTSVRGVGSAYSTSRESELPGEGLLVSCGRRFLSPVTVDVGNHVVGD